MKTLQKLKTVLIIFNLLIILISCDKTEKRTEFFENGQMSAEYHIIKKGENFIKEGSYKVWHENGMLKLEETYKKGEVAGKSKLYSNDGKLKRIFNYKDGLLDGKQENFKNGINTKELYYDKGAPTKIWIYRNLKGETIWQRDMRDSIIDKVSYLHKESGTSIILSKKNTFVLKRKSHVGYAKINKVDKGNFYIVDDTLLLDEANYFYKIKSMSDSKLVLVPPTKKKEMIFLKTDRLQP